MWSTSVQREIPWRLRRRRRPTSAGAASTCSGSATSTSCRKARASPTPTVEHRGAPRRTRATASSASRENSGYSKYNSLQLSVERRYADGLKVGVAYTLGKSEDNAQRQAQRALEHVRRHELRGTVQLRPDGTCCRSATSTICRSGAVRRTWSRTSSAAGRFPARRSCARATPFSITRARRSRAASAMGSIGQPVDIVGDPDAEHERPVLDRHGHQLRLQPGRRSRRPRSGSSGTRRATSS